MIIIKNIIIKNKKMILTIDEKILSSFNENNLFVYFYNSGCEGTKINISSNFDIDNLEFINISGKIIYYKKEDEVNLDGGKILLKIDNDKGHKTDDKYLFVSNKIKSRCSCSTSFSFENKIIDSNKLKKLKKIFKNINN